MICNQWEIAVVPFPFAEKRASKRRPALVLSAQEFNQAGHTVLAMITTHSHKPWPGDTVIEDYELAGLKLSCVVRLKLFTLDNRFILKTVGRLSDGEITKVKTTLKHCFGF